MHDKFLLSRVTTSQLAPWSKAMVPAGQERGVVVRRVSAHCPGTFLLQEVQAGGRAGREWHSPGHLLGSQVSWISRLRSSGRRLLREDGRSRRRFASPGVCNHDQTLLSNLLLGEREGMCPRLWSSRWCDASQCQARSSAIGGGPAGIAGYSQKAESSVRNKWAVGWGAVLLHWKHELQQQDPSEVGTHRAHLLRQ